MIRFLYICIVKYRLHILNETFKKCHRLYGLEHDETVYVAKRWKETALRAITTLEEWE